jgi:hypothetical protein
MAPKPNIYIYIYIYFYGLVTSMSPNLKQNTKSKTKYTYIYVHVYGLVRSMAPNPMVTKTVCPSLLASPGLGVRAPGPHVAAYIC